MGGEGRARARARAAWERESRHCGRCGAANGDPSGGSGRRECSRPGCGGRVYPRVDPVALVLVESPCRGFALLVSPRNMPRQGMFSCVAGFVEQSESAERAGAREVLEEAGLPVGPARLVASQPWPRGRAGGCELMLGMVARAIGGAGDGLPRLQIGNELQSAVWASRAEVAEALGRSEAKDSPFMGGDGGNTEGRLWLPPKRALAHDLLRLWSAGDLAGAESPQASL